jgi:hypothetical protein
MTLNTEMSSDTSRIAQTQGRCAHLACSCIVPAGEQYCSEACRIAPSGGSCSCNHPGCAHADQMRSGASDAM